MNLTELREGIELLEEYASKTSIEWRKEGIEWLTTEYLNTTGKVPDGKLLERMADTLLHAELTDNAKDKMSKYEYPILSDMQYARRTEGRHTRKKRQDGGAVREVPLAQAKNIGADGRDYSLPVRVYKK